MRHRKNLSFQRKSKKRVSELGYGSSLSLQHGDTFQRAFGFHQKGQLDKARELYQQILEKDPTHADALHLCGLISHQARNYQQAIELISKAIRSDSGNAVYHYNLGVSLIEAGRKKEAMISFRNAIRRYPHSPESWYNLANLLKEQGDSDESLLCYRRAVEIRPDYAQAYFNMARLLKDQKKYDEAIAYYHKASEIRPNHAQTYNSLANALFAQGKVQEAVSCYRKAVEVKPDYAEAWYNMATVLHDQEKFEDALSAYQQAISVKPDYVDAYNNMGIVLCAMNRYEDALLCYRKAITLMPHVAGCYNNLGATLSDLRRYDEALSAFNKALELNPRYADAYNNMGNLFKNQGKPEEAISAYRKALSLQPDYISALNNIGLTLKEVGKSEEAMSCYRKVLTIKPDEPAAYSNYFYLLLKMCFWKETDALKSRLEQMTRAALAQGRKTLETPFENITYFPDPLYNFNVARSWSDAMAAAAANSDLRFAFDKRERNDKIVVGYLSFDFRHHAVGHLIAGIFGCHDRSKFRIIAYSYGYDDGSEYRRRIAHDCDEFIDIRNLSNTDAAQRIYNDRVDILVDLMGHTGFSRMDICAFRPAPVQVTWLGFPGTSGADFIDYIITDKTISPESHEPYYSEKFVYMPHTYQSNDRWQKISDKKIVRSDAGLPEQGFVFCSFSQSYKIEPVMFDIWMRLLTQVENSVLWLIESDPTTDRNLRQEAQERGVNPDRLIFAPRMAKDEHLARHRLADLVLDTRIYNGHTTTSDALYAGVPVIAMLGKHFASRVSASLLKAIGMPDMIVHSLEEYEVLALRLAQNPAALSALRERLENNRLTKPLFDTPLFVRHLEAAYLEMQNIFQQGQKPKKIEISC
jgi:pentatricopeptide repeat protein